MRRTLFAFLTLLALGLAAAPALAAVTTTTDNTVLHFSDTLTSANTTLTVDFTDGGDKPAGMRPNSATFDCRGTWDSATAAAKVSNDGTNFVAAEDGTGAITCTADCAKQLFTGGNGPYRKLQIALSGAGGSASLACRISVDFVRF